MDKKVEGFESLEVWQESTALAVKLYEQLKDCKDYGIRDQIQRAAVSIASNIAAKINVTPLSNVEKLQHQARRISAMLYKLIQYRRKFV